MVVNQPSDHYCIHDFMIPAIINILVFSTMASRIRKCCHRL